MPRRTPLHAALALALGACAFTLPASAQADEIELQVTPAGEFAPSDGRTLPVPAWRMDAAIAARVIQRFGARKTRLVIDYEHQTLKKEDNGQPAPAAAWFKALHWRAGAGLFATVELTARARAAVAAREYLYFSPVFTYDPRSGDVVELLMGALTNYPAIDGMEPLALRAAATFGLQGHHQEPPMAKLLAAVCMALSLPATTTEDEAAAAVQALEPNTLSQDVRSALGLPADADDPAVLAACTALMESKAGQAGAAGNATPSAPDPAKYVSVAVVEQLRANLAALSARLQGDKIDELVKAALADTRLLPAQEQWARELGQSNLAALSSYLQTAQPIPALTGTQTGGQPPADKNAQGLTEAERAVCTAMGLTPEQFKAAAPVAA